MTVLNPNCIPQNFGTHVYAIVGYILQVIQNKQLGTQCYIRL